MRLFIKSKFFLGALLVAVFLLIPEVSLAGFDDKLGNVVANGFISFANLLLSWIVALLGTFLALAAGFADMMMQPTNILNEDIVKTGWEISRDFANMFFILILLAIALSFILFPSFQIKKSLPWLLIVALFINFSLPIAGIFLDFANVFTNFFLDQVNAGSGSLTETIAQQLRIVDLNRMRFDIGSPENLDLNQTAFATLIFSAIFTSVLIFIFAAIGIMFMIRTAYLYILLILLPLVLVASILPAGRSYFSQWTSSFIKWTFFAPIATFFIYLSVLSYQGLASASIDGSQFIENTFGGDKISTIEQTYNYITIFFLLIGSLFAANSLGIKGASASIGMLKGAERTIRGSVTKRGKKIGGAMGRAGMNVAGRGAKSAARGLRIPGAMEGLARGLNKTGAGRFVGTKNLTRSAQKLREEKTTRATLSADDKKLAEKMSTNSLLTNIKAGGPQAHEYAAILASRGELPDELAGEMLKKAENYGSKDAIRTISLSNSKAFENNLQEKSAQWLETKIDPITKKSVKIDPVTKKSLSEIKDAHYKSIKPSDLENINDSSIDKDLITNMIKSGGLSGAHLKSASTINKTAFLGEFTKTLKSMSSEDIKKMRLENPRLLNWLKSTAAQEVIDMPDSFTPEEPKKKKTNRNFKQKLKDEGKI